MPAPLVIDRTLQDPDKCRAITGKGSQCSKVPYTREPGGNSNPYFCFQHQVIRNNGEVDGPIPTQTGPGMLRSNIAPSLPVISMTSSVELHNMAADPSKVSYFSLPGEIRNKIMDLVLVHGEINTDTRSADKSRAGVQLLAICKHAYQEGHELFYSSNTFHLSPTMPFEWSDKLQAKQKALIKRVSITLGLDELTPAMVYQIERSISSTGGENGDRYLRGSVMAALMYVWKCKFEYLRDWSSLEEIVLCSYNETITIQHHKVVADLAGLYCGPGSQEPGSLYWQDVLSWPMQCSERTVEAGVLVMGWKGMIKWLYERQPGELIHGAFFMPPELRPRPWGNWKWELYAL